MLGAQPGADALSKLQTLHSGAEGSKPVPISVGNSSAVQELTKDLRDIKRKQNTQTQDLISHPTCLGEHQPGQAPELASPARQTLSTTVSNTWVQSAPIGRG